MVYKEKAKAKFLNTESQLTVIVHLNKTINNLVEIDGRDGDGNAHLIMFI